MNNRFCKIFFYLLPFVDLITSLITRNLGVMFTPGIIIKFMFLKANKASNFLFIFANIYFKLKYCIVSSITERKKYKAVTKIYFATAL